MGEENYKIRYDIPKDGGFIFNPPTQAFKIVKFDDKEVINEFGNLIIKKLILDPKV